MKKLLQRLIVTLAASLSLTFVTAASTAGDFDHTHSQWTAVLHAHVKGGAFDYGALKKNRGEFDGYLRSLHAVTPKQLAGWSKDQRFAFWINTYNAHTIQKVIDKYPLDSIRDLDRAFGLSSVFDHEFIPMVAHHPGGDDDELSLNDIEHEILRANFKDARLHAAVNCASASCPNLRNEAFVAKRLNAQLDEQMRSFIADPTKNKVNRAKGRLRISEIFKWFKADFDRDAGSVNKFIERYWPEDDLNFLRSAKIDYVSYEWDLNDV